MLANLIAKNIKVVPYQLDVKGTGWEVSTNGSNLNIQGKGWSYANPGNQQNVWIPTTKYTINRNGEMLNLKGQGWAIHSDQTVLDVHDYTDGVTVGTSHRAAVNIPGL